MTATFNYLLGVIGFAFIVLGVELSTEFRIPAIIIGIVIIGYAFKRMVAYNRERVYGSQDDTDESSQ